MRAIKLHSSDFFVVKHYTQFHSCDTTFRKANHRQATLKVLGSLICSNYGEKKDGLRPKQIIDLVRISHGVQINYKKAWRTKEEAQILIRGTPEDSYHNLSKWLYKVQEKNPGTKIYLQKDQGKFKYTFLSFGQSIRGFEVMRRVVAVDGTFLKGKFRGTLLAATAQDGDFHLYPLAFAIVDSENNNSWTWFFDMLKTVIPDATDLVFVSDRAPSIATALKDVYPLAHHGICRVHLLRNLKPSYAKKGLISIVEAAANAYTVFEFDTIFTEIRCRSPELAKTLEEADFSKWARSHAPSNRFNIMSTNIAESLNSMLNMPRELPVISLLETIRLTLSTWFHERRTMAAKHDKHTTPNVMKKIIERYNPAMILDVYQFDDFEFEVKEEAQTHVVNLEKRQCTCCVFDIEKIPCIHAIAAAKRTMRDENKLVDYFYTTKTFAKAYVESINPCGDLKTYVYPENISE